MSYVYSLAGPIVSLIFLIVIISILFRSHLMYFRYIVKKVKNRHKQVRKKKDVHIEQEKTTDYMKNQIIRKSKRISKASCFFDESLLVCDICLEVMHNAMNVSPCNHKFCAGCIYEWNSFNSKCPKCRWGAADITRDTTLNSIIEQYLIAFPEKKRDAAQLIELDERELDHLEKWERKRDTGEGDFEHGYFEVNFLIFLFFWWVERNSYC
ncbi:zinc finger, C3HC4 type [Dictyocaulus viviparus]|uniref:Zinc finger, C3HC4 type n=1 Tax=Dictyocaulus viviparus TaxID=29172 RepID=A0A0D8XX18_DICVI|nr:zinc finger, C3HC4 type [Dictyocaulus viviparus]